MKFVSVHGAYKISISPGTQRAVVHPSGVTEFMPNNDAFSAQFELKVLSVKEIAAATEQLLAGPNGRYAFGALPAREEGAINILDAMDEGYTSVTHEGYDPYQNLSSFDTEDPEQCPPEWKAQAEAYLLDSYEFNRAFVRVDDYNLTPPWPTYPLSGKVNVEATVAFAKSGGMVATALEFELAGPKREAVITALKQAYLEERAKAEKEEALSAQV